MGIEKPNTGEEKIDESRRGFLKGAAAVGAMAALGASLPSSKAEAGILDDIRKADALAALPKLKQERETALSQMEGKNLVFQGDVADVIRDAADEVAYKRSEKEFRDSIVTAREVLDRQTSQVESQQDILEGYEKIRGNLGTIATSLRAAADPQKYPFTAETLEWIGSELTSIESRIEGLSHQ